MIDHRANERYAFAGALGRNITVKLYSGSSGRLKRAQKTGNVAIMNRQPRFIDLFCGCGGLALGFNQAGFKSVFAVDKDKSACATYQLNFGHNVFADDISKLKRVPVDADLVIGGPPCQGFSSLGQMSLGDAAQANHVALNKLWVEFLRIVDEVDPKGLVLENVPPFLQSREYLRFGRELTRRKYNFTSGVLDASKFGIPQVRRRGFIIAARDAQPVLPVPNGELKTVKDAIGDLPTIPTGQNWHIGRNPTLMSIERYKCIPPGGNRFDLMRKRPDLTPACWKNKPTGSTDVFGRLRWDRPALTIRTEFYKPEKGRYLHPEAQRPITHREAARLQTFPDTFQFVGSKISVARMIGNAVPPRLAYHVAVAVRKTLFPEFEPYVRLAAR
jgi:DNA (cytosine-5)-methyltransferase 1